MNYNNTDFNYPSLSPLPQPTEQVLAPTPADFLASGLTQQQRKKRSKLVPVVDSPGASTSSGVQKRKYTKPDPTAPKITKPCSECGKTFWSWKALFGHMRCHPERHWRGINPPTNARPLDVKPLSVRPLDMAVTMPDSLESISGVEMTEEDHDVATCLLLLATGGHTVEFRTPEALLPDTEHMVIDAADNSNNRFECSCCKKMFNSHQALGGHRASHKNVKGCFANTRAEGDEEGHNTGGEGECSGMGYSTQAGPSSSMALLIKHSCSICGKVFSTGQALGGHMRCHWEKSDDTQFVPVTPQPITTTSRRALDLNRPPPLDLDPYSISSSSLTLDLRLGL